MARNRAFTTGLAEREWLRTLIGLAASAATTMQNNTA